MVTNEACQGKTDTELVALTIGEADWFYCLAKRYEERLLRYILRISGMNNDEAEDILQEVFIKTFYHLNGYDPRLQFSSWVYRITHNETISAIRKRNVRPAIVLDEREWETFADEFDLVHELDNAILRERIDATLRRLDEKYREVLVLRFLEGMEYTEISDVLHKPISTVGNLIARGKKRFLDEYQKDNHPQI